MKRITAFTLTILLTAAVITGAACGGKRRVRNDDDIADFLGTYGISVTGGSSEKTVTIPAEFGEVYENYNELQKRQGFDLTRYRSREATVYTFCVAAVDGEHTDCTEAHVMVCDGEIIGCDLSSSALDGGMREVVR